jgi:hypothetical protein
MTELSTARTPWPRSSHVRRRALRSHSIDRIRAAIELDATTNSRGVGAQLNLDS